jgi:hypothetical protein
MQQISKSKNNTSLIVFNDVSKLRRELDNIYVLIECFKDKGIEVPKDILKFTLNESYKNSKTDANTSKD